MNEIIKYNIKNIEKDNAKTDAFVKDFKRDGFACLQSVLTEKEVNDFLSEVKRIDEIQNDAEKKGLRVKDFDFNYFNFSGAHHYNTTRYTRKFDELIGNEIVINLIEKIMGEKCILSQTELRNNRINKSDSYAFEFHRDGRVLLDADIWVLAFWMLNDVTEENGPTEIKPETHRKKDNDSSEEIIKITGKAGDVVLMNSNALHRATMNLNGKDRWVYIPTYNPWYIKPSVDHIKYFTKKEFNDLSELQKQVYGFTSIVPWDETKRIYTLRPWEECIDEIKFLDE